MLDHVDVLSRAFEILEAPEDTNLPHYFVRTNAVLSLAESASAQVIATGIRGIGKSAAYKFLTEIEDSPSLRIGINKDIHKAYLPEISVNYQTAADQCFIDLMADILAAILRLPNHDLEGTWLEKASGFVENYKKAISKGGGIIRPASFLGAGFSIRNWQPSVLVASPVEPITQTGTELLREATNSGLTVRLVIDDPEEVLSSGQTPDIPLIGGFCLAAIRLSQLSPNLKIVCLLKTGIYHELQVKVGDLTKYPDHLARLCWTPQELVQLVEDRVEWARRESHNSSLRLFDADEEDKLLNYLTLSVRNGARDLVRWIHIALAHANRNGRQILQEVDLQNTISRVASASLTEIGTAYGTRYPEIQEIIKVSFQDHIDDRMQPNQFAKYIDDMELENQSMRRLARLGWMQRISSLGLLKILFEVGAIGIEINSEAHLPYECDYDATAFDNASTVFVDPLLAHVIE